jgi:excisionase family DNA binding protein
MTPIPEKVPGEQFLTLAEARERLRVSRATLYRLTHDHGLRVVKCGGVRRIAESELRRWAAQHTEGNGHAL